MNVQLTIRDVPVEIRDELKVRAAARHMSMQEFLLSEIERIVSVPSRDTVIARIQARKRASNNRLDLDALLSHRDADRR